MMSSSSALAAHAPTAWPAALPADIPVLSDDVAGRERLARFIDTHRRLFVLTGAGCSTRSGIPDYRDAQGNWKRAPPITWQHFAASDVARARYWSRSLVGWPAFAQARPNGAHAALMRLQQAGRLACLVTQNVDGLHQAAGSDPVVDLHGRLDRVCCTACAARSTRAALQSWLMQANPDWIGRSPRMAPDGDADFDDAGLPPFVVPVCPCGGMLRPDVVFFGETVPPEVVRAAFDGLGSAEAMLIVGSSLSVHSGFRFARWASQQGMPLVALNLGRTRAEAMLAFRVAGDAAEVLAAVV
jgi:NAD-dependent SIR2 family protein deacetylase